MIHCPFCGSTPNAGPSWQRAGVCLCGVLLCEFGHHGRSHRKVFIERWGPYAGKLWVWQLANEEGNLCGLLADPEGRTAAYRSAWDHEPWGLLALSPEELCAYVLMLKALEVLRT